MLHWYCKATYNLGQIFSLKRHTIWDGGSIKYSICFKMNVTLAKNSYFKINVPLHF